jgi:hypothetical protein
MARRKSNISVKSDVVVTPRMLAQGAKALADWREANEYQTVAAIYRAMAAQAPHADLNDVARVTQAVLETLQTLGYAAKRDDPAT